LKTFSLALPWTPWFIRIWQRWLESEVMSSRHIMVRCIYYLVYSSIPILFQWIDYNINYQPNFKWLWAASFLKPQITKFKNAL
jgi:hypothetical protein